MSIAQRIHKIEALINSTAKYYQRAPQEIHLLAVSKGHSVDNIKEAFDAGLRDFGENHLQEALIKMKALHAWPICWHFIGSIQRNKIKHIAQHFTWVHSISRPEIAVLLEKNRPQELPPLNVCLQINFDNEETKSGIKPQQAYELAATVMNLPRLKLRGLMTIPKPHSEEQQQYESLLRLKTLVTELNSAMHLSMDTLSMGMSDDLIAAIRAGSTYLRIGRAIFGERYD
ncbi:MULTISPECIES: YggS family pyridoxal phosphate-dependent enzyme [unclassified Legionella]|uniref:YggS family pyridoxal phosphate-dependent enzyme n=1 Tax=unclassified Legionella TaxID=2622702 RepID=UPI001054FD22|nr:MULTISPECIES: YggS family pyridoxal phosphate-dependent enzyme [unclassified Legionella]MDI9819749.1 YggS family pyridoxal phosphate-dependent enzyme [Legionella sp. PL877]